MPPTTASRNGTSELTGKVVAEAGRAMLPVLSGKLLAAVADRAVGAVDSLAGRLDDYGAGQRDRTPREEAPAQVDTDPARPNVRERSSAAWSLVITQTRVLLDFLMTLLRKAAEFLRNLAARARQRQAPEGTDAELEALEDEDLDETDDVDEDADAEDLDDEDTDDEEPADQDLDDEGSRAS